MQIRTKLPKVGTTIFTVMSQLAMEHKAVNLGQGFPDFEGPQALRDSLTNAMSAGRNQYAPMTGIARLREQIALKTERLYGRKVSPDTEVTVTSGATEANNLALFGLCGDPPGQVGAEQLQQRLLLLDVVALFYEPLRHGPFGDALAELGHHDVDHRARYTP